MNLKKIIFCSLVIVAIVLLDRLTKLYVLSLVEIHNHVDIFVTSFLNIILESLIKWFAPILSFTTEEIFTLISKDNKSIHLEKFMDFPKSFEDGQLNKKWIELKKIKDICNISIEAKRASKEIGSSLETNLIINLNKNLIELIKNIDMAELCITSAAEIIETTNNETTAQTKKAEGEKCSVCWKITKNGCARHPN